MTDIYLAFSGSGEGKKTLTRWDWEGEPVNLLVSFDPQIFNAYKRLAGSMAPAKMMLDSGAFTAWSRGIKIDIDALTEESKKPKWTESVCLDVVGDPDKSLNNAVKMKAAGSPAYPVFHIGEPLDLLREYCRLFDKVGLSCLFGEAKRESYRFLTESFKACYPHKFHSFGWTAKTVLRRYPFHSADSSSWVRRPASFGLWASYGGKQLPTRGKGPMSAAAEVRHYLNFQRELKLKWLREMRRLNT